MVRKETPAERVAERELRAASGMLAGCWICSAWLHATPADALPDGQPDKADSAHQQHRYICPESSHHWIHTDVWPVLLFQVQQPRLHREVLGGVALLQFMLQKLQQAARQQAGHGHGSHCITMMRFPQAQGSRAVTWGLSCNA
jgi:hypothetical protein